LFQYFNSELSHEQAITNIKTNTRQYAKRQLTWFKKEDIHWFDVDINTGDKILSFIEDKVRN
jgi:tRNA dimethylallyltransferase